MKLPSISALAKAIAAARRIWQSGNFGRAYIDYSCGVVFVEEFVKPYSHCTGPALYEANIWLANRSYECAAMNLRKLKREMGCE